MVHTGKIFYRLRRLGRDDCGAVFIYGAIVIFICLGFFGMTYDTMRYIESKMISQNAADAAAMEMAAWQARGLNAIQELNTDIYQVDAVIYETMNVIYIAGEIIEDAELAAIASFDIPLIIKLEKARKRLDKVCGPILQVFKALRKVTINIFKGMRLAYLYGTNAAGYIGAVEAAKENGAVPIANKLPIGGLPAMFQNVIGKLYAVGVPLKLSNPFKLPLEKKNDEGKLFGGSALNTKDKPLWDYRLLRIKLIGSRCEKALKGNWAKWDDEFYQSDEISNGNKYPYPAWLWLASSEVSTNLVMSGFFWGNSPEKLPNAYSYAIGLPIGGNVVRVALKDNRKPGNGAGIEPALVPVSELKNWNSKLTSILEKMMFMH